MKKFFLLLVAAVAFSTCNKNSDDHTLNIFSVEDDIAFGRQTDSTIMANPSEYPILNRGTYSTSYAYVEKIRDKILGSGKVFYKDKFDWTIKIIDDEETLNAFCTPGGYIYVYTGLMKYLDTEDQLAGVLGHEMAHADRRHSLMEARCPHRASYRPSAIRAARTPRLELICFFAFLRQRRRPRFPLSDFHV